MAAFQHVVELMGPLPDADNSDKSIQTLEKEQLATERARSSLEASARPQMVELDIHVSKDGHLVLVHDTTVDGTTNGSGRVADLTFEELRSLDAGYRFTTDGGETYPFRGQGLTVPTLKEVLDRFAHQRPDLIFYLDFKAVAAVAPTLELLKEYRLQDRLIFGATEHAVNQELLRLKPTSVPTTPDEDSMLIIFLCFLLGLSWLVPLRHEMVGTGTHHFGLKVLSSRFVCAMHARKRWVAVFGPHLNHPDGQKECIACGYDILMTDNPDVLLQTLEKIT